MSDGLEYSVSVSFGGVIVQPTEGKFKAESAGEYIISYQTTIYGEEVTESVRINVTELALNDWDAPNYSDKVYYEDDRIEVKPLGSVADNKGNPHNVTVNVSFQTNAEASSEPVVWEDGSFTAKAGIYTITYSVQLNGDTPSEVKTVTINVADRILEWEAPAYNQEVKVNTEVSLIPCTPKDNAGKEYLTEITVYFKDGDSEIVVKDGVFTPSQTGSYVITYTLTFQGESQERTVEVTVKDPIAQAKEQGFAELESYVDAKKSAFQDAYSQSALEQIDQALLEAKAKVESAATVEDINAAVQAGKEALDDVIVTDVTNRLIFGNVRVVGGDGNNQLTLDKVTIVNDSTTDKNTTPGTEIEMKISFKFSADYKGEGIAIAFDILNFEYFNNMHTKNGAVGFDTTGLNFDLKLRYEADTNKGHGVAGEKTLWSNRNNGEDGYYNACSSLGGLQNVTDINTVYLYLMPSGTNAAEGTLTLSWYFKN